MRLFLAIDPGDDCRRQIGSVVAALRSGTSGILWVKPDKLHLTMAFLGDVSESRVQGIVDEGRRVLARHGSFTATVSGAGVFPNWRKPRVVWLGTGDSGALDQLGADVGAMCTRLGFVPDHPFRAHLTIGRVNQPLTDQERNALRNALASRTEVHLMNVSRVSLMRSTLGPGGSVYTEVASFSLSGA